MNFFFQRVTPVAALCLAPVAFAFAGAADPAQPVPGAPPTPYRSVFSDYRPLRDDPPGDWRSLNDAVKDDGMAAMPGMGKDKGKDTEGGMPGMPGMGKMPGHSMPMTMPKERASAGPAKARAPAAPASMPAMKGMANMPGHSMHDMPGGKP